METGGDWWRPRTCQLLVLAVRDVGAVLGVTVALGQAKVDEVHLQWDRVSGGEHQRRGTSEPGGPFGPSQ